MPRTIPQLRNRIVEIAAELEALADYAAIRDRLSTLANELRAIADESKRKAPTRKVVRKKFPKPTDEEADEIASYAAAFPDAQLLEIANCFHTSQGRVSEIINGFRDADQ